MWGKPDELLLDCAEFHIHVHVIGAVGDIFHYRPRGTASTVRLTHFDTQYKTHNFSCPRLFAPSDVTPPLTFTQTGTARQRGHPNPASSHLPSLPSPPIFPPQPSRAWGCAPRYSPDHVLDFCPVLFTLWPNSCTARVDPVRLSSSRWASNRQLSVWHYLCSVSQPLRLTLLLFVKFPLCRSLSTSRRKKLRTLCSRWMSAAKASGFFFLFLFYTNWKHDKMHNEAAAEQLHTLRPWCILVLGSGREAKQTFFFLFLPGRFSLHTLHFSTCSL